MKQFLLISMVGLLFCSAFLEANDTAATIPGGRIEYKISKDISMDLEILKISCNKIEVTYNFTNHSSNGITTQVAFPLPLSPVTIGDTSLTFPSWDDLYHAYLLIEEAKKSTLPLAEIPDHQTLRTKVLSRPFTDFKRTVNDQEYGYSYIARAIKSDGTDITDTLIKNNIPLSATYISGFMEEGAIHTDSALKKKLERLNLIDAENHPLWQIQMTYIWNQVFPAKETLKITHSYTPHVGEHWLQGKQNAHSLDDLKFVHRDMLTTGKIEDKKLNDFCISEEEKKAILAMFKKQNAEKNNAHLYEGNITYRVKEVRYILSTGANWKGSIKKFHLEIIPPTPTTIVLCCLEGKLSKTAEGNYIWKKENFTPKSDLKILFIDAKNFRESQKI